jgi:hypothetical protein
MSANNYTPQPTTSGLINEVIAFQNILLWCSEKNVFCNVILKIFYKAKRKCCRFKAHFLQLTLFAMGQIFFIVAGL